MALSENTADRDSDPDTVVEVESPEQADAAFANNDLSASSVKMSVTPGRFITNLVANLAFFVFVMALEIWFTPYLIRHLGAACYGIIPLIRAITGYMTVLTVALNSALARYMTIALERGEDDTANRYFNTSLFGSVFLVLTLLIPAGWAVLHTEMFIVVPAGQVVQARWLFACTAAAFLLHTVRTPFEVSTYCLNRFDLANMVRVAEKITYVGLVVALFSLGTPQMSSVGFGMVAGTCVACVGSAWVWRILTPSLRISISRFEKGALKSLTSTGGWLSLGMTGAILFLGIELVLVNRLFGPESGGQYAALAQWSTMLRALATVVASIFGPTVFYYYARDDIKGLIVYARRSVKCLGVMLALPIGLVCGLSDPLLRTWLGPDFADLSGLMTLMTIHLSVNLAVVPFFNIQTAANRVRCPAIVTVVMGIVNVGLALFLAGPMGWGMYGVAAAGAIVLTGKNVFFTPLYAAHILRCRQDTFLWELLPIIAATLAMVFVSKVITAGWDVSGWPRLVLTGSAISAIYAVCAYWGLLNADDRALVRRLLSKVRSPVLRKTSNRSENDGD